MDRDQQVPVVHALPAPLPTPTITIHEVDENSAELLGEGQYAKVYKVIARNPNNHQMETVVIKTNKESQSASRQIVKEIRILCQMSDAHVVEFISRVTHPARPDYNAFLMELLDLGSAFSFYTGKTGQEYVHMLSNEQVRTSLCHQVIHAVDYVHRTATVHGDISCNNVLMKHVNSRFELKLSDFGSAFKVAEGFTYITGTRLYCAEEVFRKRDCTQASDVFSVAATCFFLKYGRHPVPVTGTVAEANYAQHGGGRPGQQPFFVRSRPDWNLADPLEQLLNQAMDHVPERRPTVEDLLAKTE